MPDNRRAGPSHAAIIAVIVAAAVLLPILLSEQGEAITNFVVEVVRPMGLLLLPIGLILIIHFLSSAAGIFSTTADRNTVHRVSASPVGVVMVLLLVLVLLHYKVSIFSRDDDSD